MEMEMGAQGWATAQVEKVPRLGNKYLHGEDHVGSEAISDPRFVFNGGVAGSPYPMQCNAMQC